jgi:hypothetical protein
MPSHSSGIKDSAPIPQNHGNAGVAGDPIDHVNQHKVGWAWSAAEDSETDIASVPFKREWTTTARLDMTNLQKPLFVTQILLGEKS